MPVVAEKIRSGLVELRTKSGLVYVSPSFSERLYLLWTFRNFHRLPVQVLNRRQRQVLERLGQTAVVAKSGPVPRNSLIGSVENFEFAHSDARAAAGTARVVRMNAPLRLIGKAAGSDAILTETRRRNLLDHPIPFPGNSGSAQDIRGPEPAVKAQPGKPRTRRLPQILVYQGSGKWLGVGLLVACCFALLLFNRGQERTDSSRPVPQGAIEARNPSSTSGLSPDIAEPEKVQSPIAAQKVNPAKTIAFDSVSPQPSGETQTPAESTESVVSTASLVSPAPVDTVQRPHISEWPEGGFSYPIAPSPTLTGTVLLKAVIGVDGTVTSVDILSGNRSLATAAAEAVRHWRYPPHKVNGIPTEAETNIVIDFRGDEAVSVRFPAT